MVQVLMQSFQVLGVRKSLLTHILIYIFITPNNFGDYNPAELSMVRLDQARTQPEPKISSPNPKIISSCNWARKSLKICLIQMQNFVQIFFHKSSLTVYSCAKPN